MARYGRRAATASAALVVSVGLTLPAGALADTFTATDAEQAYTVPAGASQISVVATGAEGGGGGTGGRGAVVSGMLPVTPGQVIYVDVGGRSAGNTLPGFNGGGARGGGGASDVRALPRSQGGASLNSRLLVAGGGGGSVFYSGGDADGGAGATAGDGSPASCGGGGGTQSSGGSGGSGGPSGSAGTLGNGGAGAGGAAAQAGGGGGGLYGGGGGGGMSGGICGAGGGGSSYAPLGGTKALATTGTPASVQITAIQPPAPDGGPPAGGGPVGLIDTVKPSLTALSLSPSRFDAASKGGPIAATVGGRVSYRLSEAATVTFTVERKIKGREKGGRCVKATHRNRRAKSCDRYIKQGGSFTHSGAAGLNSFKFQGRLGSKALRRGSYRLVGVARDPAGNTSAAARRSFTIAHG